jgi:GTP-binding protein LepA
MTNTKIQKIRNFSIIAHIDHGKSTLADRMIEITNTVEARKMKEQVLDDMELERERGITIKMRPVRMLWQKSGAEETSDGKKEDPYILNLIDTPGHIDFSYEVSRALKAVEGSILLVDSTQGVQAQTLTTLSLAKELGLTIIPVVSKIDSPLARVDEVKLELATLIDCDVDDVLEVSGKTGEGVGELLNAIVERVPEPKQSLNSVAENRNSSFRGLVFDFQYSSHRGIIVYIRAFDGATTKNDQLVFLAAKEKFSSNEVGIFTPGETAVDSLSAGEIGYIVTGIKKPGVVAVGDTVTLAKTPLSELPGYMSPKPVVWASLFPESQDDFMLLKQALVKLKLSDSSLSYEEESSGTLGRGFRAGFLGMLHLEIVLERLRREFNIDLVVTTPSITYEVLYKNGKEETVYSPSLFPEHGQVAGVKEPWVEVRIFTPSEYLGDIMQMMFLHEAIVGASENLSDGRSSLTAKMPLRELMRNFFDELKSASSGYASISYEVKEVKEADVTRLDILVADEIVPAFSKVVSVKRVQEEAENMVERLHTILPRQMFVVKIQARALGRILSSKTLSAMKKDVTGYLYGGDITRKMKLREKQKKGKKKMKERGRVNIPQETFLKMMKGE